MAVNAHPHSCIKKKGGVWVIVFQRGFQSNLWRLKWTWSGVVAGWNEGHEKVC